MTDKAILQARSLRIAVVINQYDTGNLTYDEARELLSGELIPGNPETFFDDSDQLNIKAVDARDNAISLALPDDEEE
jgi:hypothetical protein